MVQHCSLIKRKQHVSQVSQTVIYQGAEPLEDILRSDTPDERAILAAGYLLERGIYDFVDVYWSPHTVFRNRVIIPFYQGDRIVGYSAETLQVKPMLSI